MDGGLDQPLVLRGLSIPLSVIHLTGFIVYCLWFMVYGSYRSIRTNGLKQLVNL